MVFTLCYKMLTMDGIIVKQDNEIMVKWSDLYSYLYGTHYMYSKIKNLGEHKIGDKIKFELITIDYDSEDYTPNFIANIL